VARVDLLRYAEGVIHFDPQVANRTLQLGVAEPQLDGPQVPSLLRQAPHFFTL
jgi:hypothetical protein